MNINTIYFTRIDCLRAEAIFGDTVEILYNGSLIWGGPLNNARPVVLNSRRYKIPQGAGGNVEIKQHYFGQPKQTVFTQRVLQTDPREDRELKWTVDEIFDGDPGGVYELYYRVSLENWESSREETYREPVKA